MGQFPIAPTVARTDTQLFANGHNGLGRGSVLLPQNRQTTILMNDPVYKTVEITGTSGASIDDAVRNGLATTAKTLRHLAWFEVSEIRGQIEGGEIKQWQTTLKVGFKIETSANG